MRMRGLASALAVAMIALAGCHSGGKDQPRGYSSDPKTLSIVAGSEQQKVLDTLVKPWCEEHGYTCTFTLKGSVDQGHHT